MSPLIAVIDNSEAIRAMFTFIARREGWTISGYSYSEIDLAIIQQIKPDLIIVDFVEQRIGEGWQLLQLLKMEESTAAIPIIISTTMTVTELPDEIRGFLGARDISVIYKPFAVERFIALAQQVLNEQSALLLSETRRLPILLVEDNVELSSSFVMVLELEGYLVSAVSNGQLALDAVRQGRYSLIFLDMTMPVMTGPEFIVAYALEPGPHTPIVIFSAQADFILEDFPSMVIGRLPKPFEFSELLAIVTQYAMPA